MLLRGGVFRLGSDSSPEAQNDNARRMTWGTGRGRMLLHEGVFSWAQILRRGLRMTSCLWLRMTTLEEKRLSYIVCVWFFVGCLIGDG